MQIPSHLTSHSYSRTMRINAFPESDRVPRKRELTRTRTAVQGDPVSPQRGRWAQFSLDCASSPRDCTL